MIDILYRFTLYLTHKTQRIMIPGTIKDYKIYTLEELLEKSIPFGTIKHISLHTKSNLHIKELRWDRKNQGPFKLYIRYLNILNKEIYKPIRSNFTKQTLWEILKTLN